VATPQNYISVAWFSDGSVFLLCLKLLDVFFSAFKIQILSPCPHVDLLCFSDKSHSPRSHRASRFVRQPVFVADHAESPLPWQFRNFRLLEFAENLVL